MIGAIAMLFSRCASGDEGPGNKPAPLAIPAAADQASAEKIVRELFAVDLAKHSPADESAAAEKLLKQADKSSHDTVARFVLLSDARDLAVAAGDPVRAWQAIDALSIAYQVDRGAMQAAALSGLLKAPLTPVAASTSTANAMQLVDRLCAAGDYPSAERVASQAETLALRSHNTKLLASVRLRVADVRSQLQEYQRGAAALDKLKQTPQDAEANLAAGTYLCFTRGDWPRGLSYLAKGSDAVLKQAALAEGAAPQTAEGWKAVGDNWWESAEKKPGPARQAMRRRAADWYQKCLPALAGLTQELIAKRITQAGATPASVIDLLALIDPKRNGVNGSWSIDHGTLVSHGGTMVRLQVPYQPPEEYDLRIVYSYTTGHEGMMLMLPTRKGPIMAVCNSDNFYFENTSGTFCKADHPLLKRGDAATITLLVRNNRIQAYFNNQLLCEFNPADRSAGIQDGWRVHDSKCLGVGNWNTTVLFSRIDLTEITGAGTRTP
jgi:hypothetical protein